MTVVEASSELAPILEANHRTIQRIGLPIALGLSGLGLLQLVPPLTLITLPLSAMVAPVAVLAHAVALRRGLMGPARQTFRGSRSRRLITRWTSRLTFFGIAPPAYFTVVTPGPGIVAIPVAFLALTWGQYRYLRWHAVREAKREPVHPVERMALVVLSMLAVGGILIALVMAWVAGVAFEVLVGWIR